MWNGLTSIDLDPMWEKLKCLRLTIRTRGTAEPSRALFHPPRDVRVSQTLSIPNLLNRLDANMDSIWGGTTFIQHQEQIETAINTSIWRSWAVRSVAKVLFRQAGDVCDCVLQDLSTAFSLSEGCNEWESIGNLHQWSRQPDSNGTPNLPTKIPHRGNPCSQKNRSQEHLHGSKAPQSGSLPQ